MLDARQVTPTELRYSIQLDLKRMDSQRGGSGSYDQSHRQSRYSSEGGDDFRQRQQRGGSRRGYPCQYCGREFSTYDDMMLHARTNCMGRYGYYSGGVMPAQSEEYGTIDQGEFVGAARASAHYYGHPRRTDFFSHGGEPSSTHYNIGRSASALRSAPPGVQTVTPMRRHDSAVGEDPQSQGSADAQSTRSVSFSPSSGRPGPSRETQPQSTSEEGEKLLREPQPLVRLLSSGELNELSEQDRLLCQSVVLFCSKTTASERQPGIEDLSGGSHQGRSPFQSPPRTLQTKSSTSPTTGSDQGGGSCQYVVGFQCAYCMSNPLAPPPGGTPFARVFPGSIETIAASLNLVKERHFQSPPRTGSQAQTPSPSGGQGGCLLLPENVRMTFESARAQSGQIRPEQRYGETMALQNLCQKVAQRLGIQNKLPHKTGIVLPAPEGAAPAAYAAGIDPPSWSHAAASAKRAAATSAPRSETFGFGAAIDDPSSYERHQTPILAHPGAAAGRSREVTFIQDSYGWSCPYCVSLPYNYRAPGSYSRDTPSSEFISRHFQVCTAIHGEQGQFEYSGRMGPYDSPYGYPGEYGYGPGGWGGSTAPPDPYRSHHTPSYERSDYRYSAWYEGAQPAYPQYRGPSVASAAREASEASVSRAIDLLSGLDEEDPDEDPLVLPDDKLLLTDYFFHLNKQLKVCRFTEKDRKTRGGKREKIELGFGGLQCRHCAGTSGSRKFFWSDVDRLANSFAEIPGHILKCRKCPEDVKNALNDLKLKHPEQMARLPRGSQKVFFRRMWKRLHQQDSAQTGETPPKKQDEPSSEGAQDPSKRSSEPAQGDDDETRKRQRYE